MNTDSKLNIKTGSKLFLQPWSTTSSFCAEKPMIPDQQPSLPPSLPGRTRELRKPRERPEFSQLFLDWARQWEPHLVAPHEGLPRV